ncbi:hypothetical protein U1Q18_040245 [Sarracenia purpurea var. burkii]
MTMEESTSLLTAKAIHVELMIKKASNNSSELSVAYNTMRTNQDFNSGRQSYNQRGGRQSYRGNHRGRYYGNRSRGFARGISSAWFLSETGISSNYFSRAILSLVQQIRPSRESKAPSNFK